MLTRKVGFLEHGRGKMAAWLEVQNRRIWVQI